MVQKQAWSIKNYRYVGDVSLSLHHHRVCAAASAAPSLPLCVTSWPTSSPPRPRRSLRRASHPLQPLTCTNINPVHPTWLSRAINVGLLVCVQSNYEESNNFFVHFFFATFYYHLLLCSVATAMIKKLWHKCLM
jgi:hypothetical protein